MFGFFFTNGPVTCFEDATKADTAKFGRFHRGMLERGVYLAPSAYEVTSSHLSLQVAWHWHANVLTCRSKEGSVRSSGTLVIQFRGCETGGQVLCCAAPCLIGLALSPLYLSSGRASRLHQLHFDSLLRHRMADVLNCLAGWLHITGTYRCRCRAHNPGCQRDVCRDLRAPAALI